MSEYQRPILQQYESIIEKLTKKKKLPKQIRRLHFSHFHVSTLQPGNKNCPYSYIISKTLAFELYGKRMKYMEVPNNPNMWYVIPMLPLEHLGPEQEDNYDFDELPQVVSDSSGDDQIEDAQNIEGLMVQRDDNGNHYDDNNNNHDNNHDVRQPEGEDHHDHKKILLCQEVTSDIDKDKDNCQTCEDHNDKYKSSTNKSSTNVHDIECVDSFNEFEHEISLACTEYLQKGLSKQDIRRILIQTLISNSDIAESEKKKTLQILRSSSFTKKKNPYNYKESRTKDLETVIGCLCHSIVSIIMPKADDEIRADCFCELATKTLGSKRVGAAIKLGKHFGLVCAKKDQTSFQRPLMALASEVISREAMEGLMQTKIHYKVWRKARLHALFPGPGEAVIKKELHRQRKTEYEIDQFLEWVAQAGLVQDLAFGHKICKYENGLHIPIAAVKKTKANNRIVRLYFDEFIHCKIPPDQNWVQVDSDNDCNNISCSDDVSSPPNIEQGNSINSLSDELLNMSINHSNPTNEVENLSDELSQIHINEEGRDQQPTNKKDRCKHIYLRSGLRCLLPVHDETVCHKFTPDGYLSSSTIIRIMDSITSGTIKSLQGLDDIDVSKGAENFERMKALLDIFSTISGMNEDQERVQDLIQLKKDVDEVQKFHKTEFHRHLDLKMVDGEQTRSTPICTCLKCCMNNNDGCTLDHTDPCMLCQKGFDILTKIWNYYEDAVAKVDEEFHENKSLVGEPSLISKKQQKLQIKRDDLQQWEVEIRECQENLEDYRAHLAQKYDEAEFDSYIYQKLKFNECIVIFDYKMKILPSYHREVQKKYFGKRGFSLLGALILFPTPEEENKFKVQYHFFISDDSTQDAHAWNCAKEVLYGILEKMGIKEVHVRIDGAGNFNSNEGKGSMLYWKDKGIIERSCKQCVPGCGKSNLDGQFGVFNHLLRRLVDTGFSYNNGRELVELLLNEDVDELKGTYYHLFQPDRTYKFETNATELNKFYFIQLGEEGIQAKVHSRHDKGEFFPFTELTSKKVYFSDDENTHDNNNQLTRTVTDNLDEVIVPANTPLVSPMHNECEEPPSFNFSSEQCGLFDGQVMTHEIQRDPSLPPMILLSDYPFENFDDASRFSEASKVSYQKRRMTKSKATISIHNEKVKDAISHTLRKKELSSIFCCTVSDRTNTENYCTFECTNRTYLREHMQKGIHTFPQHSLKSRVVNKVRVQGLCSLQFGIGTMPNRSDVHANNKPIQDYDQIIPYTIDEHISNDWYKKGCYRTRSPKPSIRKSYSLLCDLEFLFQSGEQRNDASSTLKNASKYTPENALAILRNLLDEKGRRKYRLNGDNGPLPKLGSVKSWFSGRASGKIKPINTELNVIDAATGPQLKEMCKERDLPIGKKVQLVEILNMYSVIEGVSFSVNERTTVKKLRELCEANDLPSTAGSVKALRKILLLHDALVTIRSHEALHGAELNRVILETNEAITKTTT